MTFLVGDLREAYRNAKSRNDISFMLDNRDYLTDYAKYLVEYCDRMGAPDNMPVEVSRSH